MTPTDSLEFHQAIRKTHLAFRHYLRLGQPQHMQWNTPSTYKSYLAKFGTAANLHINSFDALIMALEPELSFCFGRMQLSDHGLEQLYYPSDQKNTQ